MLSDTQFHRASFSGDLRLDNSAFTQLSVLSSNIGGTLGLNDSEARCAYHINSSSMNYFTASGAGFGRLRTIQQEGKADIDYPWWERAPSQPLKPEIRQLFESPAVRSMVETTLRMVTAPRAQSDVLRGCEYTSGSAYAEFYLFDSNIRSASCITLFSWLAPKRPPSDAPAPVSILALNGTRVTGNLIIDLAGAAGANPRPGTDEYKQAVGKHKLESIGASAGALIYNFNDEAAPYYTYIDGLNFDRIHNAAPACTGDMVQLATQVELPSTDKVLHWLQKNKAPSSQPFTAFAAEFERAGESAVNLRIGRQTYDLCAKTARWAIPRWLASVTGQCQPREEEADPAPTPATQQDLAQHSGKVPAARAGAIAGSAQLDRQQCCRPRYDWFQLGALRARRFRPASRQGRLVDPRRRPRICGLVLGCVWASLALNPSARTTRRLPPRPTFGHSVSCSCSIV